MINQNLPAGPASIDLKVSGCVGKCRKADCFHSRNKINQNLSAGQTAACSVELVSGILIVFVIFSLSGVLSFIFAGRGARMRGEEPQGEGRSLPAVTHSPLSLRFSPSRSLFPYSHLSKLRVFFVYCISKGLRSTEGKGIRKAGARGRKPKGKGRPERQRRLPFPLGCHPRFVGRNDTWIE